MQLHACLCKGIDRVELYDMMVIKLVIDSVNKYWVTLILIRHDLHNLSPPVETGHPLCLAQS